MALSKIQAESMNLADTFAFTGTVSGAGDLALGVSQTWTDVKSSRAVNTYYTNSTGRPIMMYVNALAGSSQGLIIALGSPNSLYSNQLYTNSSNGRVSLSFVIQNGQTYKIDQGGTITINDWWELR